MMDAAELRGVCHEIRYTHFNVSGISQLQYMETIKMTEKGATKRGQHNGENGNNPKFNITTKQPLDVPDEETTSMRIPSVNETGRKRENGKAGT